MVVPSPTDGTISGHGTASHVTVAAALLVGRLGAAVHVPVNHAPISVTRLPRIVGARAHGAIHVYALMVGVMRMFQRPLKSVLLFLFALIIIGVLVVLGLNTMSERGSESIAISPQIIFLRDQGILYVKSEYHQAQMGLSITQGGGDFRPLTTTYEWWVDAQNPRRVRRVTAEWLEDGPHLVAADGADGENRWWEVDWARGITQTIYHQGQAPFALPSLKDFVGVFAGPGQRFIAALQQGEAEAVAQAQQAPWGKLLSIRKRDPTTGQVITATVRAEPPHVLIERVTTDREGKLFETLRITRWEWLDVTQWSDDFWMTPPKEIQVGP